MVLRICCIYAQYSDLMPVCQVQSKKNEISFRIREVRAQTPLYHAANSCYAKGTLNLNHFATKRTKNAKNNKIKKVLRKNSSVKFANQVLFGLNGNDFVIFASLVVYEWMGFNLYSVQNFSNLIHSHRVNRGYGDF